MGNQASELPPFTACVTGKSPRLSWVHVAVAQEKGKKQLLSYVATKTPEVGGRFILDIATRR